MKIYKLIACLLLGLVFQTAQAKVALVIGNDAYSGKGAFSSKLEKAVSNAHTIGDKLRGLGYQVIEKHDLNLPQMQATIHEFQDMLKKDNEVGVFYYAGMGVQFEDTNYLIPLGTEIQRSYEIKTSALSADYVLYAMKEAGSRVKIVILDVCRDNSLMTRGTARGLVTMSEENAFILFATQKNGTADDGIFVEHLKNWLDKPDLTIDEMARKVRDEVRDATKLEQIPMYINSLSYNFYFNN